MRHWVWVWVWVCVWLSLCVCAGAGICAYPTFPWRQQTQSGGHGCRERSEKHQQEPRLSSGEGKKERDVTKLDCSNYNHHSCLEPLPDQGRWWERSSFCTYYRLRHDLDVIYFSKCPKVINLKGYFTQKWKFCNYSSSCPPKDEFVNLQYLFWWNQRFLSLHWQLLQWQIGEQHPTDFKFRSRQPKTDQEQKLRDSIWRSFAHWHKDRMNTDQHMV